MAENGKEVLTVEEAMAELVKVIRQEVAESKEINARVTALNAARGVAQSTLTQAIAKDEERTPAAEEPTPDFTVAVN